MTPEEHYGAAEYWLAQGDELPTDDPASARALELFQQRAQVHATLATYRPDITLSSRDVLKAMERAQKETRR